MKFMFFDRRCPVCGSRARFECDHCWANLEPVPGRAVFAYDDVGRSIILAAKNGGRKDLWRPLGRALARELGEPLDLITWVPASRRQRRRRGYDQGRLLARSVGRALGVPSQSLLRRVDRGPQTGRSRDDRAIGPTLRARGVVSGNVLVVDDVRTTGASLRIAAEVLRGAGAAVVTAASVTSVERAAKS
jgi:predicted amidophosphoribosyltransferase